ncbi:MAG: response regulator transcription factor [Rhodobacteraceae bacterium]|nr:response regulator transcription factor [Paracoccaceae bacterium]
MRILIADDHDLLRDTLALFVQTEGDMSAYCVATLDQAVAAVAAEDRFDLILLDYHMPGMNGLEGLSYLLGQGGGQRVALMSGEIARSIVEQALAAGAAGFVPKTLSAKSLIHAIRFMAMGERYAPLDYMTAAPAPQRDPHLAALSLREMDVLKGLAAGRANKEIARDLGLSEATVKLHVKTLYRKIGVANRTQAAIIGKSAGL